MQTDNKPDCGRRASLSRRTFLQFAAAGSAATLPAVALAGEGGKTARPSPQEAKLANLISRHALLVERIKVVSKIIEALASRPDKPSRMITVADVAQRKMDYPHAHLARGFHAQSSIDEFVLEMVLHYEGSPFGPEISQRIRADWLAASDMFLQRAAAVRQLDDETGYLEADEECERLFDKRDSVEEQISGMPCVSVRMVTLKARFAADWEEGRHDSADEFAMYYLASILRSMLPLTEAHG